MPSIRLSSVGGMGLLRRGAWRSIEASRAFMATRISIWDGVALALLGMKPRRAKPSPPRTRTRRVTMIPRVKLRMGPPAASSNPRRTLRVVGRGGLVQDGKRILRIGLAHLQLDSAEYMRMPTCNAKHVLVQRDALDAGRFQARPGQQILRFVVKRCHKIGRAHV